MRRPRLEVVHVVVPVRDEEATLDACLQALRVSLDEAARCRPWLRARLTVVLDSCRDDSAAIARTHGTDTVEVSVGSVGAARAAGVEQARRTASTVSAGGIWLATTDGDSRVPRGWLDEQLGLAEQGCDLVVGRVCLDPGEVGAETVRQWQRRHPVDAFHVFGASLGFRLSAYDGAGGFEAVTEHEDVRLVQALVSGGARWRPGLLGVTTSGRTVGRTPGGFAGYLRDLSGSLTPRSSGVTAGTETRG